MTYHYVRPIAASHYPTIKGLEVSRFEQQLRYLKDAYTFVSVSDVLEALAGTRVLPEKSVLLTFDDGYQDHFTFAFPFLAQNQIPAAFFIPGQPLAEHTVLDVNKIHYILASEPDTARLNQLLFECLAPYRNAYALPDEARLRRRYALPSRWDNAEVTLFKRLLQVVLPHAVREVLTQALFTRFVTSDVTAFSQELYLSSEQLGQLQEAGMHIGTHTYHHVWLDSLPPEQQKAEIMRARNFLQSLGINQETWTLCYPYGAYNEDTVRILKTLGCQAAFTTRPGVAALTSAARYMLPRIDTNDVPVPS